MGDQGQKHRDQGLQDIIEDIQNLKISKHLSRSHLITKGGLVAVVSSKGHDQGRQNIGTKGRAQGHQNFGTEGHLKNLRLQISHLVIN